MGGTGLWVTDGGGGTFANIWTPSTFAQAGCRSEYDDAGAVSSSEHHVPNEVMLDHVAGWRIYALQTEEGARRGRLSAFGLAFGERHRLELPQVSRGDSYQPF
jgi:hypothetical protein